jgi:N-methylhydantoinase A
VRAFHREHRRLYSYDLPNAPVELVNLRVAGLGALAKLEAQASAVSAIDRDHAVPQTRPVYFEQLKGFAETPCYVRQRLGPGMTFNGPAIVDQDDATTVIYPNFRARIDTVGNLILERQPS